MNNEINIKNKTFKASKTIVTMPQSWVEANHPNQLDCSFFGKVCAPNLNGAFLTDHKRVDEQTGISEHIWAKPVWIYTSRIRTVNRVPSRIKVGESMLLSCNHWIKRTDIAEYSYTYKNLVGGLISGATKTLRSALKAVVDGNENMIGEGRVR